MTDPEDVLEFLRERDRAALNQHRRHERKGVIIGLIVLAGLLFGGFMAYLRLKGVH